MIGVNTTVVPLALTRHGPGGWMETIARFGRANRPGGPGGIRNVSMFTTPLAVVMLGRVYPGSPGGPGGMANGIPKTTVFGAGGGSCTVTTVSLLTVTVTGPSGVCTVSGTTTQMSVPGSQTLAALAGAAKAATALAVSPTASRSDPTRRPGGLPGCLAGQLPIRCGRRGICDIGSPFPRALQVRGCGATCEW